jgi:hypothetical protein
MDELPPNAKALIALARSAEQPPQGAQERVRAAVAVAISVGAATATATAASHASASAAGTTKAGWLSGTPVKLAVVGGVVAAIGTATVLVQQQHKPTERPAAAVVAPQRDHAPVSPATAIEAPIAAQAPAVPLTAVPPSASVGPSATQPRLHRAKHARPVAPAAPTAPAVSTLHEEMTLLSEASSALDRGDLRTARAKLSAHAGRFAHGQLAPERRGLEMLHACLTKPAAAVSGARAYLKMSPSAVLAARIAAACKLEKQP